MSNCSIFSQLPEWQERESYENDGADYYPAAINKRWQPPSASLACLLALRQQESVVIIHGKYRDSIRICFTSFDGSVVCSCIGLAALEPECTYSESNRDKVSVTPKRGFCRFGQNRILDLSNSLILGRIPNIRPIWPNNLY